MPGDASPLTVEGAASYLELGKICCRHWNYTDESWGTYHIASLRGEA